MNEASCPDILKLESKPEMIICDGGEIKWLRREDYCPYCKRKTVSGMQDYYDSLFCLICRKIKGSI